MSLLDLLFPPTCVACGCWGSYICSQCINKVAAHVDQICPMCGRGSVGGKTHPGCRRSLGLDGVTICLEYTSIVSKMIIKLKYQGVSHLSSDLCNLAFSLADLTSFACKDRVIVPIPLHRMRQQRRGFNQAELIGQELAKYTRWPFTNQVLQRHKVTRRQSLLTAQQRSQNIKQAFSLTYRPVRLDRVSFLLVDDVWTTGATMREAARPLKRAGAREVWGFVLAS